MKRIAPHRLLAPAVVASALLAPMVACARPPHWQPLGYGLIAALIASPHRHILTSHTRIASATVGNPDTLSLLAPAACRGTSPAPGAGLGSIIGVNAPPAGAHVGRDGVERAPDPA